MTDMESAYAQRPAYHARADSSSWDIKSRVLPVPHAELASLVPLAHTPKPPQDRLPSLQNILSQDPYPDGRGAYGSQPWDRRTPILHSSYYAHKNQYRPRPTEADGRPAFRDGHGLSGSAAPVGHYPPGQPEPYTSSRPTWSATLQTEPAPALPRPTRETSPGAPHSPPYQTTAPPDMIDGARHSIPSKNNHARYVRTQDIPGRGRCHFYDDGTFCEAEIAGEPVNPEWGVTKAGKPRKRLAQACTNCREKKIRCEPGVLSCSQCMKLGKTCVRVTQSRNSPESSLASEHMTTKSGLLIDVDAAAEDRPIQSNKRPRPPATPTRDTSPLHEHPVKRERVGRSPPPPPATAGSQPPGSATASATVSAPGSGPGSASSRADGTSAANSTRHSSMSTGNDTSTPQSLMDTASFMWETDPYEANSGLTMLLLDLYFEYRDSYAACVFPRDAFSRWVMKERNKSKDDKMLLYTVLALGSIFGKTTDIRRCGTTLANIARQAERERAGRFTLQLAQTRVHFTLYYFACGNSAASWEMTATALRVLSARHWNTEDGVQDVPDDPEEYDYGLNRAQLVECRRRTFWITYLTDRYSGFCSGHIGLVETQDAFLRLPNNEDDFQAGHDIVGPYMDVDEVEWDSVPGEPGVMALLVGVATIWGDIQANAYREFHRPTGSRYVKRYEAAYASIEDRLARFEAALPSKLRFSTENMHRAIKGEYFVPYFIVQSVQCICGIKVNRIGRFEDLSPEIIKRNIQRANYWARRMFDIVHGLERYDLVKRTPDLENALSQPFPGYAILCACDILSCGGPRERMADTTGEVALANEIIQVMARFYSSARTHQKWAEGRVLDFAAESGAPRNLPTWRFEAPMEASFLPVAYDIIYGVSAEMYEEAIGSIGNET